MIYRFSMSDEAGKDPIGMPFAKAPTGLARYLFAAPPILFPASRLKRAENQRRK
jgi:hypothetical protein